MRKFFSKIVNEVKNYQDDIILLVGVILISLLSFAAGYIAAKEEGKEPLHFERYNNQDTITKQISITKFQFPNPFAY